MGCIHDFQLIAISFSNPPPFSSHCFCFEVILFLFFGDMKAGYKAKYYMFFLMKLFVLEKK